MRGKRKDELEWNFKVILSKQLFCGAFKPYPYSHDYKEIPSLLHSLGNGLESGGASGVPFPNCGASCKSSIIQLELCSLLRMLLVVYSDEQLVQCAVSKKGLKQTDSIKVEKRLGSGDAVCASLEPEQQILAVGTKRAVVELYDLAESTSTIRCVFAGRGGRSGVAFQRKKRYSVDDTGPVSCIAWTPDNSAFAVGWRLRGLTVWSVSGCRLLSTIRQIVLSSVSSPGVKPVQECKYEPLIGGTSLMQCGYGLCAIEERCSERTLAFSFGTCCLNRGVSGATYARQVIQGEGRIIIVQSGDTDELKLLHVNLPVKY